MFVAYVIVSSLLALACLASGAMKVTTQPGMVEQMGGLGVARKYLPVLGTLLILGAIGLVVGNWVGVLGVAAGGALTLYFIGAIITHVRAHELKSAPPAIVFAVAAAAACVLRLLSL
jgi:hypothetical protein